MQKRYPVSYFLAKHLLLVLGSLLALAILLLFLGVLVAAHRASAVSSKTTQIDGNIRVSNIQHQSLVARKLHGSDSIVDLKNCNYLNDANVVGLRDTKGRLKPYAMTDEAQSFQYERDEKSIEPFHRNGDILFHNASVYYLDGTLTESTQVKGWNMLGYALNFLPQELLEEELENPYLNFLPPVQQVEEVYQKAYHGRALQFSLYTTSPLTLHSDGLHLAWAQLSPSTDRREIVVSSLETGVFLNLQLEKSWRKNVTRSYPVVCGKYLVYQEFLPATSLSSVWMYNFESHAAESLNSIVSGKNISYFYPTSSWASDPYNWYFARFASFNTSASMVNYTVAWLETSSAVSIDSEGNVKSDVSAWRESLVIHILALPAMMKHLIKPTDWQTGIDGKSYTSLDNILMSQTWLFFQVSTTDGSSHVLGYWNVLTAQIGFVTDSVSAYGMGLASASDISLAYWLQIGTDNWVLNALSLVGKKEDPWFECHCNLLKSTTTESVYSVSLFEDQLVWKMSENSQHVMYRLDLNKDNDNLWDANDRFPLDGTEIWDSDNDGIGDGVDFLPARGKCVSSETQAACVSDDQFLYLVWVDFLFSTILLTLAGTIIYKTVVSLSGLEPRRVFREDTEFLNSVGVDPETLTSLDSSSIGDRDFESSINFVGLTIQIFFLVLTLVSVLLAIIPVYRREPFPYDPQALWLDFFITTLFFVDLVSRYLLRDSREYRSSWSFVVGNWYDFPSLITDLPGLGAYGVFNYFLVLTRFARLFRLLRLLKVFRVLRLYHRLAKQPLLFTVMLKKPGIFLFIFIIVIIAVSSLALKVVEQDANVDFVPITSAIWFALVTVTTVGYGDIYPITPLGRFVTVILMLVGIGIIGTLSGAIGRRILDIGKTSENMYRLKREFLKRNLDIRQGLSHVSVPYNPIVVLFGERYRYLQPKIGDFVTGWDVRLCCYGEYVDLPLNDLVCRADPRFGIDFQDIVSRGGRIPSADSIVKHIVDHCEGFVTPLMRLTFLLTSYKLDDPKHGVVGFNEFSEALRNIIFPQAKQNDLFIEKVFALRHYIANLPLGDDEEVDFHQFDLADPLEMKMAALERLLDDYGLISRLDYLEVLCDLQLVILYFDRVESAKWVTANLEYKDLRSVTQPSRKADTGANKAGTAARNAEFATNRSRSKRFGSLASYSLNSAVTEESFSLFAPCPDLGRDPDGSESRITPN